MKYKAPEHTSEIYLSTGPVATDSTGHIEVADELHEGDVIKLCAAGYTPVAAEAPKAKASAAKEG